MQLLCLTLFFRDFLGSRVFYPAKQIWIKENQKCFNEKNLKAILNGFNIYLFIYLFIYLIVLSRCYINIL